MKVLIHGFKGTGKDRGALAGVQAFLALVKKRNSWVIILFIKKK